MSLSMLSALARLNVDPWDEAARLAALPRQAATSFLASLLAALPNVPSARAEAGELAARLIALLPQRVAAGNASAQAERVPGLTAHRQTVAKSLVVYLVLMAFFLVTQWLLAHVSPAVPSSGTAASQTATTAPAATPPR